MSGPDPAGGRGKYVSLTPRGERAQAAYHRRAGSIVDGWRARSGDGVIDGLARALRALYAQPDGQQPLIAAGLVPYPDGWRAHPPYQRLTEAMIADPAARSPTTRWCRTAAATPTAADHGPPGSYERAGQSREK